jgi:hypothetical protein
MKTNDEDSIILLCFIFRFSYIFVHFMQLCTLGFGMDGRVNEWVCAYEYEVWAQGSQSHTPFRTEQMPRFEEDFAPFR